MSEKSNDTPSSTRVRDNQRRSRTRRAELLNDLQQRVHEYELQGVAATQEMQRAARKVAQDNVRLRGLLAIHGVSREEVESYLQLSESRVDHQCGISEANLCFLPSPARSAGPTRSRYDDEYTDNNSQPSSNQQHIRTTGHSEIEEVDTRTLERTQLVIPEEGKENTGLQGPSGLDDTIRACSDIYPPECQNSSGLFCAPALSNESSPISSGMEISCETAATIIVEMRGDGDRELVRASLGCSGREGCNIKNTTVMQVMDER